MRTLLAAAVAALVVCGSAPSAHAQLTTNSIEAFCSQNRPLTTRRTTIIIDPSSINPADQSWWQPLLNFQLMDFLPREPVSVLIINRATGSADEVFGACFPAYSSNERAALEHNMSPIDRFTHPAPASVEHDTQMLFRTRLQAGLAQARSRGGGPAPDMLRVLAGLPNSFGATNAYNRVVIYSHMQSAVALRALGAPANGRERAWQDVFNANSISVGLGEFFIYGAQSGGVGQQFWEDYFLTQGGTLSALSPNLQINRSSRVARVIDLQSGTWGLSGRNSNGVARLRFAVDPQQNIPLGIASFYIGATWVNVPFRGTYACSAGACRLTAAVMKTVPYGSEDPYFRQDADRLVLSGRDNALAGSLIVADAIGGGATSNEYRLSFRR
jgi:hypothetical protein